jgi:predicted RNase H-like HicB family nuclease
MKTYFAVVSKECDSAYGLWFPDVEGCFAAAEREEDILSNAIEALLLHLEDGDHPLARQVHEVASDPLVAEDLASCSHLIAVPLVTAKNRSVRVNLSLDTGLVDAIDAAARLRGLSRSGILAEAAQNEIRRRWKFLREFRCDFDKCLFFGGCNSKT